MSNPVPSFLLTPENRTREKGKSERYSLPFIDKTLKNIGYFIKTGYVQNDNTSIHGLFQQLNARVKLLFLVFFIVLISISHKIQSQLLFTGLLFAINLVSHNNLLFIYKRVLFFGFFFGFLIIAPAALNFITHGKVIFTLVSFEKEHQFWVYHIPQTIGITREGCFVVSRFFLKVVNSLTVTFLVVYTTPFNEIVKSLKILRVPDLFLMVLTLTYKYIFILSHTIEETYFALKAKWWKRTGEKEAKTIIAGRIVFLFRKSWLKYEEIYKAMIARGFSGKVNLCYLKRITGKDWAFLGVFIAAGTLCYIL